MDPPWFNTRLDCFDLTIDPKQKFEIWSMRTNGEHLQIAFDPGDRGFLRLTIEESSNLFLQLASRARVVICGYPLKDAQKLELAATIREPLPQN